MQFSLRDLKQDVLCISVFDQDMYSPNGMQNIIALKDRQFGCAEITLLCLISDKFPLRGASATIQHTLFRFRFSWSNRSSIG
jgi:hypothetical protein